MMSACYGKGEGFEVRLYDSIGEESDVEVKLPFAASSCQPVDFNGNPLSGPDVTLRGHQASFQIKPWEIVTLRFER